MFNATLLARCALAAVFLCSGAMKLRSLAAFDAAVVALGALPPRLAGLARPVGLGVIGAELATAVLTALPATAPDGLALATVLLAAFTALIGRSLRRTAAGAPAVSCACFGAGDSAVGRVHLVRNVVLLALALGALAAGFGGAASGHALGPWPATALAPGLLLALFIVLIEDLAFLYGPERGA